MLERKFSSSCSCVVIECKLTLSFGFAGPMASTAWQGSGGIHFCIFHLLFFPSDLVYLARGVLFHKTVPGKHPAIGKGQGGLVKFIYNMNFMKICNSVMFYFMKKKNSFSDLSGKCILPDMIRAVLKSSQLYVLPANI